MHVVGREFHRILHLLRCEHLFELSHCKGLVGRELLPEADDLFDHIIPGLCRKQFTIAISHIFNVYPRYRIIGTILVEILCQHNHGLLFSGFVKSIETQVSGHIVNIAVVVKIACGKTVPPTFVVGNTGGRGDIFQFSFFIVQNRNRHELSRQDQVFPTIIIGICPYGITYQPEVFQARRNIGRNIREPDLPVL